MNPEDLEEQLRKETYNAFDACDERQVTVADIVKQIDVTQFLEGSYRGVKFSKETLANLLLFRDVEQIRKDTELLRYLEEHPGAAIRLGCHRDEEQSLVVPDQRTISRFRNTVLTESDRAILESVGEKVEEVASKMGVVFDVESVKIPEDTEEKADRTKYDIWRKKSTENWRQAKSYIYKVMDLPTEDNAVYHQNRVLDVMSVVASNRDSITNVGKSVSFRNETPHGDTVLHRVKQLESREEIEERFREGFDRIWEMAKSANVFNRRRVNVAVDFTKIPYYGDENASKYIQGIGPGESRGTNWGFKFATICIVDRYRRFNLLSIPVHQFNETEDLVEDLLDFVMERVRIRHMYLDREFYDSDVIEVLQRKGVNFIIPAPDDNRIKEVKDVLPANSSLSDYPMQNVTFNLFVTGEEDDAEKRVFATNIDLTEYDEARVARMASAYGKRWGIESAYRVVKNTFLARTSSTDFRVRLFLFLFAALFYNLWILIDLMICDGREDLPEEHTIYSPFLANIIMDVVRGLDPPD